MDRVHTSDPIRPRLVVLWTALVASVAMLAVRIPIASPGATAPYRTAAVLMTIALAAFELIGDKRTELLLVGPAVIFAVLSIVELRTGIVMSFFDPGTTLALLILLGILFAATRVNRRVLPVVLFCSGNRCLYALLAQSSRSSTAPPGDRPSLAGCLRPNTCACG